jgi:predicted DNA-binding transcriptional regulator YafY
MTSMESAAGRLLELLSLLQARPRWTADGLAERLSVTPRTVRRDVTRLRDLGYPVHSEAGPAGGYQLGAGGSLPPLLLADDEAVAVAIGLRAAASGGVAGFDDAAVAALAKLEQVLPARLRERVAALATSTVLVARHGGPLVDPEMLLTLAQGCRGLERVHFAYRDGEGRVSDRRVEPYRLVSFERRWYLVGRDLDRDDWRTFRVDRIGAAALTGHRFVRAAEPDAGRMVADGMAMVPYRWQAEVVIDAPRDAVAEVVPPTIGAVELDGGATVLRLGANELDWIARYLAGLPFTFDVRGPDELRTELRRLGRRLVETNRRRPRRSGNQPTPPRPVA